MVMQEALFFSIALTPLTKYPYWSLAVTGLCILLLLWMFYRIRALQRKISKQRNDLLLLQNRSSELEWLIQRISQLGKISFFVGNLDRRSFSANGENNFEIRVAEAYIANMLPADRERFRENYSKLLTGELQSFQNNFTLNINSRQRKHLVNVCLFTTPEATQKKVMLIAMDITDFEDQHGKLIKADSLLKNIFDNIPGYMFLKNVSSDFTYERCSPTFSALTNRTPDDLIGQNDFNLFDRNLANKIRARDLEVVRNNITADNRWFFYAPDGNEHAIRFIIRTLHHNDNSESILGFGLDVTTQEHIASKMRKRNKDLRMLMLQLSEAAMLIDIHRHLLCATGPMQNVLKSRFGTLSELTCERIFDCGNQRTQCAVINAIQTLQCCTCSHCSAYGRITVKPLINEQNSVDYLAVFLEPQPTQLNNENQ